MSGLGASAARSRCSPWALAGYTNQADSLLDELLEELEHSLEEGGAEEYPYLATRPPLLSHRSSASGGLLLGLLATLVVGLAFWLTLRPRVGVFSLADPAPARDPRLETPKPVPSAPPPAQEPSSNCVDLPKQGASQEPRGEVAAKPEAGRPVAAAPPPSRRLTPPAPLPSQEAPPPMKLVGLIHDPGAPKALILVDKVVRQVQAGQRVKGEWRVTSITRYGVAVSNGVRSLTLQLGLSH